MEDFVRRLVYRKGSSVTFSLHRLVSSSFVSAAAFATSSDLRYALGHETCELTFERLDYSIAPALGDGRGCRIGEDILFTFFQPVEDALRRGLGRGLRD